MTYLEICKFVHLMLGIGDALPGTAPTTVTGQTGLLYEITQWVNLAYSDVQQEQANWNFMNQTGTFSTSTRITTFTTLQSTFPTLDILTPFFDPNGTRYITCHPALSSTPVNKVFYEDYSTWRGYRDRDPIPTGLPAYYTIAPNKSFQLWPTPDQTYTFNVNYRSTVDVLTGDSSVPIIPPRYHDAIGWRAIYYWALQRENPNKLQLASRQYEGIMNQLRQDQLPEWFFKQTLYYAP